MTRLLAASVLALSLVSASSAMAQSYTAPAGIPAQTAEAAGQGLPGFFAAQPERGAVYTTGSVGDRVVHHRKAVNR